MWLVILHTCITLIEKENNYWKNETLQRNLKSPFPSSEWAFFWFCACTWTNRNYILLLLLLNLHTVDISFKKFQGSYQKMECSGSWIPGTPQTFVLSWQCEITAAQPTDLGGTRGTPVLPPEGRGWHPRESGELLSRAGGVGGDLRPLLHADLIPGLLSPPCSDSEVLNLPTLSS